MAKLVLSEDEWRQRLTPEQYEIMRQSGTETAFSSKLYKNRATGTYSCGACGAELFSSSTKFDAGCGWPSFYDVLNSDKVILKPDHSHGMIRTEVRCANCDSHLGHLFDDGPKPTGQRYCINGAALQFQSKAAEKPKDEL